jgi:sugar phosphate isomerase/epimerase
MMLMDLRIFKTLWGFNGDYTDAARSAVAAGLDGLEGPAPKSADERQRLADALALDNLLYIAEVCTAGSYVPDRNAGPAAHIASLENALRDCKSLAPLFVNCIAGCDAWPLDVQLGFFRVAMELADGMDIRINFETHRSRSLFNPWITERIVTALPDIRLTCDFSHWCVVCERLVDTEIDIIRMLAQNACHIHARVGYDQGPQVPHPAAPEYAHCLASHQAWWEIIWSSQRDRGLAETTMTPEFGPDGYLHQLPFTRAPVADLWEINQWMAETERGHFRRFMGARSAGGHDYDSGNSMACANPA